MEGNQTQRIWLIVAFLVLATSVVTGRLIWLQVVRADALSTRADEIVVYDDVTKPERGYIYDRNGAILAAPDYDYEIGVDRQNSIQRDSQNSLARLDRLALELVNYLDTTVSENSAKLISVPITATWVSIQRNVPADVADQLVELKWTDWPELTIDPEPRRMYPQGMLMCHELGYVDSAGAGHNGAEGYYNRELTGEAVARVVSILPTEPRQDVLAERGSDLVLTIDRTVQATVERHLREALAQYGARSGTIVVLDPKTGAILAMASDPCYDPETYFELSKEQMEQVLPNPAVSLQYEPGSIMKLITMAAALDGGGVVPSSTYADGGVVQIAGQTIRNASNGVYGTIDMTQTLVWSVNTATVWAATRLTPETYYTYLERFGFGRATGVDLAGEIGGSVIQPSSAIWTEAIMATNAFGQSISVTPLQMISAIGAIANGGRQMRPYIVQEVWRDGERVFNFEPTAQSVPISEETARALTNMAIQSGQEYARVEGYTLAGKSGTAQIPVVEEGGIAFYHPTDTIASFVGWLPADDPAFAMIVKLDVPTASEWGSQTAGPTFAKLAEELVVLLNVPPDNVRLSNR